ncbi:hypothetical protein ACFL5V_01750 [Fibrobacterota bacterium]
MSATTQVKVLSPEITLFAQGQGFHFPEANSEAHAKEGECVFDVPGSESVAGKRTVHIGTWENQSISGSCRRTEDVMMQYAALVVGLTHSRGVNKVMLIEDKKVHSKGLAVSRKKYGKDNMLSTEVDKVIHRNGWVIISTYFYICMVLETDLSYKLSRNKHVYRVTNKSLCHVRSEIEEPDVGNSQVRFCEGHGLSHMKMKLKT